MMQETEKRFEVLVLFSEGCVDCHATNDRDLAEDIASRYSLPTAMAAIHDRELGTRTPVGLREYVVANIGDSR